VDQAVAEKRSGSPSRPLTSCRAAPARLKIARRVPASQLLNGCFTTIPTRCGGPDRKVVNVWRPREPGVVKKPNSRARTPAHGDLFRGEPYHLRVLLEVGWTASAAVSVLISRDEAVHRRH